MSDLQYKSSQKYFTVFQFLNPNGITFGMDKANPVIEYPKLLLSIYLAISKTIHTFAADLSNIY